MNQLIEELKKNVRFKDKTEIGDHVLIVAKNPRVVIYALVVSIDRDTGRKDEWWHVKMHLLTLPPQTVTWTLREPQFSGKTIFTMQGVEHFMKAVDLAGPGGDRPAMEPGPVVRKIKGDKQNPFSIVK